MPTSVTDLCPTCCITSFGLTFRELCCMVSRFHTLFHSSDLLRCASGPRLPYLCLSLLSRLRAVPYLEFGLAPSSQFYLAFSPSTTPSLHFRFSWLPSYRSPLFPLQNPFVSSHYYIPHSSPYSRFRHKGYSCDLGVVTTIQICELVRNRSISRFVSTPVAYVVSLWALPVGFLHRFTDCINGAERKR